MTRWAITAVTMALVVCQAGHGWTGTLELEMRALAEQIVAAVNDDNLKALKQTIHPASLAAMTEENRAYYETMFRRNLDREVPEIFLVKTTAVAPGAPLLLEERFTYPVRPTHAITIDYQAGTRHLATISRYVARYQGRWYVVIPAPTGETLAMYREQQDDRR